MKGDFSRWKLDPKDNQNGVLHQQGRVLLDWDLNDQTWITRHWQDTAGRDAVSPGVAGVPVTEPNGFRVLAARVVARGDMDVVEIDVHPGHVWADGILTHLKPDPSHAEGTVLRDARYLEPPLQDPSPEPGTIGPNVRDAVILELNREALSAFQVPEDLIEPALGGPDTTCRILTAFTFRLLRLEPGEDCYTILDRLRDDLDEFGRLTVSLEPVEISDEECPVVTGGGYTGFEHNLYRVEIADVDSGGPQFKWSQFNGGLVGRGRFVAATSPTANDTVIITANRPAIVHSGLTEFYLEAVQYDSALGTWRVTYGARASLNDREEIELEATPVYGSFPTASGPVFFRLWNGIREIAEFTDADDPVELRDGIRLVFDPPADRHYRPGDYWIFPVRAGEIENDENLVNYEVPHGVRYHRVPLAIVEWDPNRNTSVGGSIHDCRRRFRPLTRLDTCCTVTVGDGRTSLGDYTSIQDAIDALPREGGKVCILPGTYQENIRMVDLRNVTLSGCGMSTRLMSPEPEDPDEPSPPAIHVVGGQGITVEDFAVRSHPTGVGLLFEGVDPAFPESKRAARLNTVVVSRMLIGGEQESALRIVNGSDILVQDCVISVRDVSSREHAVYVLADDVRIERNRIIVRSRREQRRHTTRTPEAETLLAGANHLGGIQIGGGSDRVHIAENVITGGRGNGITLGSLMLVDEEDQPIPPERQPDDASVDPCAGRDPLDLLIAVFVLTLDDGTEARWVSAGNLTDVRIEHNHILNMGACGIAIPGFFPLGEIGELVTVEDLSITGNEIRGCLRRTTVEIRQDMLNGTMGYGAVTLADTENLMLHDNTIVDNGPSHLEPVCGIYLMHGTGVDISRNRILNNGARAEGDRTAMKPGPRGGVVVTYALAPAIEPAVSPQTAVHEEQQGHNGVPALRVHHNVITAPTGHALRAGALGPVSVTGNQLTSRGPGVRVRGVDLANAIATTVFILNLGLSNEFYLQYLAFNAIRKGSVDAEATGKERRANTTEMPAIMGIGRLLANGNVLFADNQIRFDAMDPEAYSGASSVVILTLDDVGFLDNQCDASLLNDFLFSQVLLFGVSVRASDNRFKEGIANAIFSAITLGLMNTTTDNQATHCLLARAMRFGTLADMLVFRDNLIVIDALLAYVFEGRFCDRFSEIFANFGIYTLGKSITGEG
jgi:hypothetical protein